MGLKVDGKRPVREGQAVMDESGREVGKICSGGYGPTVGGPIAMAYVARELAQPGTRLQAGAADKPQPVIVTAMPFTPRGYYRG